MSKTGIVRDNRCLKHLPGEGHPESHKRLEAVYTVLDKPELQSLTTAVKTRKAIRDELLEIHTPEYIDKLADTAQRSHCALTPDTLTCADSYEAALLAAGGLMQAITMVEAGELTNAFALMRPPGHHAERSRAMGFCLFNNVALGASFARKALGMRRVLIVDWDVHHGNGVQHAFERDASVLFISVHQNLRFPGTGFFTEIGAGRGEGFTLNIPLPGRYGDAEYAALFNRLIRPVALEFEPELILVSAGFDTHIKDPMGGMRMTPQGFKGLTRILMEIAALCCNGRLVLSLEGGYHLEALKASVTAVLQELTETTVCNVSELAEQADLKKVNFALKRAFHVHRHYWKNLK
ncbi:histone deacetylase [Desulfococcaceae bacterium HSG9]|nr:histone deacetylase [Desulfococcaceae bacterium HSG9]